MLVGRGRAPGGAAFCCCPTVALAQDLTAETTGCGTDERPEDHRWHLGLGLAVQDVAGSNIWGGRTYVRDQGYTWRQDHGSIRHVSWQRRTDASLGEELHWCTRDGAHLLTEARAVAASALPGSDATWVLDFAFRLTNPGHRRVELGSPATNGRAGAGYGGLFWRLPRPAGPPRVFTAGVEGEERVHGTRAPWVAYTGDDGSPTSRFTVVLAAMDEATRQDPWFVRVDGYPGLCSSLAATTPLVVAAGAGVTRRLRALVADGALTPADINTHLDVRDGGLTPPYAAAL